jgi:ribosomal protein S12 methylthiotransferase
MSSRQRVSLERNQRWEGRTMRVLVEGQGQTDDGQPIIVGRSFRDAPEVDGQVFAWGNAQPGDFVHMRVTQALEYDLWGEPCDS